MILLKTDISKPPPPPKKKLVHPLPLIARTKREKNYPLVPQRAHQINNLNNHEAELLSFRFRQRAEQISNIIRHVKYSIVTCFINCLMAGQISPKITKWWKCNICMQDKEKIQKHYLDMVLKSCPKLLPSSNFTSDSNFFTLSWIYKNIIQWR